jgi:hypothetical protein
MHWEHVSKLQLLYPLDEHKGYRPNRRAAAGMASLIATCHIDPGQNGDGTTWIFAIIPPSSCSMM